MDRPLLIDNDALLKLARYDLLGQALHALQTDMAAVRVLPAAKYSLVPANNRLKHCKDEATAQRLEDFIKHATKLDAASINGEMLDELAAVPGVDSGEANLFASAAAAPDSLILTGDKRALAALCSAPKIEHVAHALAGRVVALETLFELLVAQDFTNTQQLVRARPSVDRAITMVFGVSAAAPAQSVQEGLASYTRNLQRATGSLLWQARRGDP